MFQGSIVAMVTPMFPSGEIDYDSYAALLQWHVDQGTDGVVVLGTTGESATITTPERKQLIQLAVETIAGRIPVIVGTGTNATAQTIIQTREALECGADAALLVVPYYNKPTQEGLYCHFSAIAEAVPLPQILYNVPARTACDLLPQTIIDLADYTNIVAVKEATGNIGRIHQILEADVDIDVLSGDDSSALLALLAGAKGVISVVANVIPHLFHEMCHAALNKNVAIATGIDQRLKRLYDALFFETNPIAVKEALVMLDKISPGIRLPLTRLNSYFIVPLRAILQDVIKMGVHG